MSEGYYPNVGETYTTTQLVTAAAMSLVPIKADFDPTGGLVLTDLTQADFHAAGSDETKTLTNTVTSATWVATVEDGKAVMTYATQTWTWNPSLYTANTIYGFAIYVSTTLIYVEKLAESERFTFNADNPVIAFTPKLGAYTQP